MFLLFQDVGNFETESKGISLTAISKPIPQPANVSGDESFKQQRQKQRDKYRMILQPSGSSFSSYSTQYAGTSSSLHYSSMEPAGPSLFSSTIPYESALTYTSSNPVPAPVAPPKTSSYFAGTDIGSSLGARPKSGKLSSSPDDIYHSSDEEDR